MNHLFIKELGFSEGNINCIPNNEEKYISFTKKIETGSYTTKEGEIKPLHHQLRFIDSYKFMSTSFSSLVNNLPKGDFNNVKEEYGEKNLEVLTRKGVYPYDYMDTPEKLSYHRKKSFILNLMMRVSVMRITHTLKADVFEN